MKIGVIKEIKNKENRVALTPAGAERLIAAGHSVELEDYAGSGSGFSNEQYRAVGVNIVPAAAAWDCGLVVKIKEPLESEYPFLRDNFLFTYLHLAGVTSTLTDALLAAGTTAIAYETVEDAEGKLPLLAPMSAVAGNMAAQVGGYYLAKFKGGKGVQLGSVQGARHGKVMVIGTGVVGRHAALTADGMGANVYAFGRDRHKFDRIEGMLAGNVKFVESTPDNIAGHIPDADLVVGAVLVAGARAPHVVSEAMVRTMQAGSVIVDVSIDQGGSIETARPTSHSDPVFLKHEVIHYCVTNMPGAYPRTATIALTDCTLPYVLRLAGQGMDALQSDQGFARGVNTCRGKITYRPVAVALNRMADYHAFA